MFHVTVIKIKKKKKTLKIPKLCSQTARKRFLSKKKIFGAVVSIELNSKNKF